MATRDLDFLLANPVIPMKSTRGLYEQSCGSLIPQELTFN